MSTSNSGIMAAGNLRAELARQNRKKGELASLLGISRAAVTRRISGETPLDVNELCAIAAWLDVPITKLLPDPSDGGTIPGYRGTEARLNRVRQDARQFRTGSQRAREDRLLSRAGVGDWIATEAQAA